MSKEYGGKSLAQLEALLRSNADRGIVNPAELYFACYERRQAATPCCEHPEGEHETYEYRGDKGRRCLHAGCRCSRFRKPIDEA